MRLELEDLRGGYVEALRYILKYGQRSAPRGHATVEVEGMELVIDNPWNVLPTGVRRGVNTKLAAVEALTLIGGVAKPELAEKAVAGKDGTAAVGGVSFRGTDMFAGAYGPRIRNQLPQVVRRLEGDPDTRGAILQLWDPQHELGDDGCSYMCTLSLQLLIRGGKLHMHALMRSNDAWLGLPYDAFQFTQLQITVANILDIEPGTYHHRATSMHIYERHIEKAEELTFPAHKALEGGNPPYGVYGLDARDAQLHARELLDGSTDGDGWYTRTLAPLFA